jgi:hypothetical protein
MMSVPCVGVFSCASVHCVSVQHSARKRYAKPMRVLPLENETDASRVTLLKIQKSASILSSKGDCQELLEFANNWDGGAEEILGG